MPSSSLPSQTIPPIKKRAQFSESQIEKALQGCEKERIHVPNAIQPCGVLLVVNPETFAVKQVSENVKDWFATPIADILNKPLEDLIGETQTQQIKNIIVEQALQPIRSAMITINDQTFDAVAHKTEQGVIIELEVCEREETSSKEFFYDQLRGFSVAMHDARDCKTLYQFVTDSVRRITGFDRVKLYKFDQDWNGQVVAESREDYMPSYLGLNFPAADIPPQARALYMKSYIRQVVDTNYQPIGLVPEYVPDASEEEQLLDMSFSVLRSVSPVHLQYLENMNVHASMSISIMQNGRFWGLIACHHAQPYHVPYRVRMVSEIMGHVFSAQLTSLEEIEDQSSEEKRNLILERLSTALQGDFTLQELMKSKMKLALSALNADGLAVHTENETDCFGKAPTIEVVTKIVHWLKKHAPQSLYHTQEFDASAINEQFTGGFMAIPISHVRQEYIIWFRDSVRENVNWAGAPEKAIEETKGGYRLAPRSSFKLWQETVKHRCKPWLRKDLETAQKIVQILLESERIKAEHASLAKSEFLANMSHELRTPMNAIIGIVDILGRNQELDEKTKEFLLTLKLSSNGLLSLINDLLDISKIESEELQLEKQPVNLADVMEEVRSIMSVKALEKDLSLTIKKPDRHQLNYISDSTRIRQIIMNLVSNALKFTEDGFVTVQVKILESTEALDNVAIIVSDTGIGMSKQQISKVFDKFVQADESITRRYGGTGLGLAITKNLVELMQGTITIKSQQDMGSKFTVTLPLSKNDEAASNTSERVLNLADVKKHAEANGNLNQQIVKDSKKILLAEDYEGNVLVAITLLQGYGYNVTVVNNGQEAVDKLENETFDLVLMDVQMPVMDGLTATSIIKKKQRAGTIPKIPVIGMTAHVLMGDRDKCIEAGMDDYIPKPFDPNELEQKLKNYLQS